MSTKRFLAIYFLGERVEPKSDEIWYNSPLVHKDTIESSFPVNPSKTSMNYRVLSWLISAGSSKESKNVVQKLQENWWFGRTSLSFVLILACKIHIYASVCRWIYRTWTLRVKTNSFHCPQKETWHMEDYGWMFFFRASFALLLIPDFRLAFHLSIKILKLAEQTRNALKN